MYERSVAWALTQPAGFSDSSDMLLRFEEYTPQIKSLYDAALLLQDAVRAAPRSDKEALRFIPLLKCFGEITENADCADVLVTGVSLAEDPRATVIQGSM